MNNVKRFESFLLAFIGCEFEFFITSKYKEKIVSLHFADQKISVTDKNFKNAFNGIIDILLTLDLERYKGSPHE